MNRARGESFRVVPPAEPMRDPVPTPLRRSRRAEPTRNWMFAALYFLSFLSVALFGIYGSLYFKRRGVSNVQLGVLYAIPAWVGAFAPLVWGIVSDAIHSQKLPLTFMHWSAAALFPLFWFWSGAGFWQLCVLMGVFTFVFRPSIPLTDAWALQHLALTKGDYGRIRSWGSIGFIVPLVASIFVLRRSGEMDAQALWPVFVGFVGFRILSGAFVLAVPERKSSGARPELHFSMLRSYLHPFALTFFFATFASRFAFGPYYTFFSIYLDELGIADNLKGIFWIVAVGAETGLIAVSGRLLRRFGPVSMLLAALVAMAVRLYIFSLQPPWYIVLAVQSLHAFTFGAFHVASMQIIRRITPEAFRASGQTFYGALLGFGGIAGGIVGGALAETYGIAGLFRVLSVIAAGSALLTFAGFALSRAQPEAER